MITKSIILSLQKYYKPLISILFFVLIMPTSNNAQILVKKDNRFYYDSQVYTEQSVMNIFTKSDEASYYYYKAVGTHNSFKVTSRIALALFGVGVIYRISNKNNDNIIDNIGNGFILLTINAAATTVGLVSLFRYAGYKNNMRKAINHFNWENGTISKKETSSLQLGITNNGIGLVYGF